MEIEVIQELIDIELKRANEKYPQFDSRHKAYAIMLEELEEAAEELKDINTGVTTDYWYLCRKSKFIAYNAPEAVKLLTHLKASGISAIVELIQFVAMVEKAMELEKRGGE